MSELTPREQNLYDECNKKTEAEKQRADKLAAANAEMRAALEEAKIRFEGIEVFAREGVSFKEISRDSAEALFAETTPALKKIDHALSSDAGKGWVSPEEHKKALRDARLGYVSAVRFESALQETENFERERWARRLRETEQQAAGAIEEATNARRAAEQALAERDQARAEAAAAVDRLEHLTAAAKMAIGACHDDGKSYPQDPTMQILESTAGIARAQLRDGTAAKALLDELHALRKKVDALGRQLSEADTMYSKLLVDLNQASAENEKLRAVRDAAGPVYRLTERSTVEHQRLRAALDAAKDLT